MFDKIVKFFDPNERELNKIRKNYLEKVNAIEKDMEKLSDKELAGKTACFKEKLKEGGSLDDILPEAFAVVRESSRRILNMRPYDVQVIGGVALHQGRVAEMRTGEGKTLAATLPVYLNAVAGKGVHVVTVNDYLARRDARWMGPLYYFLGLSVGVIQHDQAFMFDPDYLVGDESRDLLREIPRREAYRADITYGTNNEFGFDYLRDNMVMHLDERVQRELHYAIVDEVDSILIDEARTPLIISGRGTESSDDYRKFARVAEKLSPGKHYTVYEKEHSVAVSEEGYIRVAELVGLTRKRKIDEYLDEPPLIFSDREIPPEYQDQDGDEADGDGKAKNLLDKANNYIKRKKFSSAVKLLDQILETEPENLLAKIRKGIAYDKWGKKDSAIECIQDVIHQNAEFVQALGTDGLNYDKLRQLEDSLLMESRKTENQTAEPDNKITANIWFNKGNAAMTKDDYRTALAAYSKTVELNSNDARAWSNLGITYFKQGNNQKAVEHLEKATQKEPNVAGIWFNLGITYKNANMFDKALECFRKAYELRPDFAAAYNNEGVVLEKIHDREGALQSFEKALELAPPPEGEEETAAQKNRNGIREELEALQGESHGKFPGYQVSDTEESDIEFYLQNALKAKELYKRDDQYIIKDDQVIIVDEFTGRLMFGRRYSDGLHQAIEAKENVKVRSEDQTLASITFQNYFRLYEKLAGMTGTAATEEKEFRKIYNVDVLVIPTNKPMIRDDTSDRIYKSEEIKYRCIINEVEEMNKLGRPVLVGTRSIEKSEILSSLLKKRNIKHNVLNAKHHEKEAQIISEAGRAGAVTIATNMAGRGVDIVLGGQPPSIEFEKRQLESAQNHYELVNRQLSDMKDQLAEKEKDLARRQSELENSRARMTQLRQEKSDEKLIEEEAEKNREINGRIQEVTEEIRSLKNRIKTNVETLPLLENNLVEAREALERKKAEAVEEMRHFVSEQDKVKNLGGLHIIGTERHESRRIDNQLRGRSGRQGDPGSSRFYVALDDELMRLFGSDRLPDWLKDWSEDDETPLEMGIFTRSIQKAQEKVESHHFDIRKSVLDYDNVMNEQRKVIYGQRDRVLHGEDLREQMVHFIEEFVDRLIMLYVSAEFDEEQWDLESLFKSSRETFLSLPGGASVNDLQGKTREEIKETVLDWAMGAYNEKEEHYGSELMRVLERWTLLQIVDSKWMDHLATMDQLREGIGLRAYGQKDPLIEYINESHEYFQAMNESIKNDTVKYLFRAHIHPDAVEEHYRRKVQVTREHHGEDSYGGTTVRKGKKVGRNDPCPCGSGKKYKKCCGRV